MKVINEIEKYAAEADKPCLLWLFALYHWESQWMFVARMKWERHGKRSFDHHRVWSPSPEGWALYRYAAGEAVWKAMDSAPKDKPILVRGGSLRKELGKAVRMTEAVKVEWDPQEDYDEDDLPQDLDVNRIPRDKRWAVCDGSYYRSYVLEPESWTQLPN